MPDNFLHPGSTAKFTKYQGTGNDFILIDWPSTALPPTEAIRFLCDRRLGVGADGLLLFVPPAGATPPRMILFNPDGSRPEMCGNGIRCAALHARQWTPLPQAETTLVILTDAGPRNCRVLGTTADYALVSVAMGCVPTPKPLHLEEPTIDLLTTSVGNPHAVALMPIDEALFQRLGPSIATHPAFPDGTNVEFAVPTAASRLRVRVWERGAGPTLACGTGACAAVASAISAGLLEPHHDVIAELPGGELTISWDAPTGTTTLTGAAQRVYRGEIEWKWPLSFRA